MDFAWSAKPQASWRWDPREATQGELQGELLEFRRIKIHKLSRPQSTYYLQTCIDG